jgi:hypothetical protein
VENRQVVRPPVDRRRRSHPLRAECIPVLLGLRPSHRRCRLDPHGRRRGCADHHARARVWAPTLFSNLGIDPKQRKILVVKSNQHFYASFSQIAVQVLYAEGDGALPRDYRKLPWQKIRRPIWPLDAETVPRLII